MLVHIIDDDETMRRTLARSARKAGWEPVPHPSADAFLAAVDALGFGCILCDVAMPGKSGVELIQILHRDLPEWPVVMMTGFAEVDATISCFRSGAVHFLRKPFRREELVGALEEAMRVGERRRAERERRRRAEAVARLSPRESEILSAFARGDQSKTIAWALGITTRTVEMHRSNILAKLGARNTSQAVALMEMAGPTLPA